MRHAGTALVATAITYAFLAGFHTIFEPDMGWLMAGGRWVVQHHQIPRIDVLSYTAHGNPWTYPALSGVFLYGLYLLGGYPVLTWLTAVASAVTAWLLTRNGDRATAILAIVAVPILTLRISVRAELFSTVLFAAVLSLLWNHYRTGQAKLGLLPAILVVWVNLHWGFVAGLGVCLAYVSWEAADLLFLERRTAARQAVHLTSDDPVRWKRLADMYQAVGRTADSQQATRQIKP